MPGYDMGMDDGMGMRRRPMGRGVPGGGYDMDMAANMPMGNPLDMGEQSSPMSGGMDFAMGDNPMGNPPMDDYGTGSMGDPLGGDIGGMDQPDGNMMGGLDASSMAGYGETDSFDSAYRDMDNDGMDYGPDPMENVNIDMGERMFDEGSAMEGNTLGDLLTDADSAPEVHSFDIDDGINGGGSSMGGDMSMVSDAVSDYKSMGGMQGSMDAGMPKSMEYRGMGQRPMAPMRGGRGKMMY